MLPIENSMFETWIFNLELKQFFVFLKISQEKYKMQSVMSGSNYSSAFYHKVGRVWGHVGRVPRTKPEVWVKRKWWCCAWARNTFQCCELKPAHLLSDAAVQTWKQIVIIMLQNWSVPSLWKEKIKLKKLWMISELWIVAWIPLKNKQRDPD